MGRRLKTYGLPIPVGTIAATSTTAAYAIVPKSGRVEAVYFSSVDATATHASNHVSFTLVNLGQAGAGTTDVILATAANSTNSTGGAAIAANTKRSLSLHGTAANLDVVEGDRLKFLATAGGTTANTNTFSNVVVLIAASGA